MQVLITGATGWIGSALLQQARARAWGVRAACRSGGAFAVGDIGPATDWRAALAGCDCVIHLAAQVCPTRDTGSDALAAMRRVNCAASLNLARQALQAGVRRMVFVSSVKVHGASHAPGQPFAAHSPLAPVDDYARSKAEAELGLGALAQQGGLELVVVRPPLVYGPGVRGNFAALMRAVARGYPLPLGALRNNRRSLVALDNLVDLLLCCATHPAAAGQRFLVSDGEDVSTADLLQRIGQALGCPARLLPLPLPLLRLGAALLGKGEAAGRLLGDLQVDMRHTRQTLGWTPVQTLEQALCATAAAWQGRG